MVRTAVWQGDESRVAAAYRSSDGARADHEPGVDGSRAGTGSAGVGGVVDGPQPGEQVAAELLGRMAWEGRDLGWEQLVEAARALGPDPALKGMSDAELDRRVRTQAAQLAAATCRWLGLLAELVVRGVWADQGARSPAQWLSWTIGMAPSTARDHVRVALQLRELPLLRGRFGAGRISYSKVRALTRVAVPEVEEMLVAWSQVATAAEIERIVGGFRGTQRAKLASAEEREAARGVAERLCEDGLVEVRLRLLPEEALEVRAMIDRLVELERSAAAAELETHLVQPDQPALQPERGDPVDGQGAGDAAAGSTVTAGPRRGGEQIDALLHALAAAVAAGPTDTSGADRHTLVVHADLADLADPAEPDPTAGSGGRAGSCPTAGRGQADADVVDPTGSERGDDVAAGLGRADAGAAGAGRGGTAGIVAIHEPQGRRMGMDRRVIRRLACEAGIVLVARDDRGTPMDVGRRERRLSAALRRALLARDRSCRFPGCGAVRHLHAHHVWHWADGGPTDLANLVLVCATHHRFVHDHDWEVTPSEAGRFTFAPPGGSPLPAVWQMADADRADPDDLIEVPDIDDPHRLLPHGWQGPGEADICLAVAVLDQELRRALPEHLTTAA